MTRIDASEQIDHSRRRLLGAAAIGVAVAELRLTGVASAQTSSASVAAIKPGTNTSFAPFKQIDAGLLNVGYAEAGPASGSPVLLLHGWPYDIYSFVDVAPLLAAAGYRVIVPFLRGYGTTRFLSADTPRNGEPAAIALDTIALMDALKIDRAVIAGFDWGARTANIIAALWPERCKATVSVSGYLIGSQAAGKNPLPPQAELQWWYQYYFATERGREGYDKYRRDFSRLIWQTASPQWHFDDATFERSAAAFDNPDHVAIVVHNYRWRLALADGEKNTTRSKSGWRNSPLLRFLPSRWRATPMARRTLSPAPTPRCSRANMSTGRSAGASATICRKRRRKPSRRPSSISPQADRADMARAPPRCTLSCSKSPAVAFTRCDAALRACRPSATRGRAI